MKKSWFHIKYFRYCFLSLILIGFAIILYFNYNLEANKNENGFKIVVISFASNITVHAIQPSEIESKEIHSLEIESMEIQTTLEMETNESTSYSDCQQKYLGHNRNIYRQIQKELKDNQQKNSICNSSTDSSIECFATSGGKSNSICIFRNITASIVKKSHVHYKLFLKVKCNNHSSEILQKMFPPPHQMPFDIEFIDINDEKHNNSNDKDTKYIENIWKVWYLDDSEECIWHKRDNEAHVGNPWHCYAHMERYFMIQEILAEYNMTQNTRNVYFASVLGNNHFKMPDSQWLDGIPSMYGIIWPFVDDIITDQSPILHELYENQSTFVIDQLIFYHLNAYNKHSLIWNWSNRFLKCKKENKTESTQSPFLKSLQKTIIDFYSSKSIINDEQWLQNIFDGGFEIYLNGEMVLNDSNTTNTSLANIQYKIETNEYHMIFMASRWIHGHCRYRCLSNLHSLKNNTIERFSNISGLVFVFGNSGLFGYGTQYNLMRNCRMLFGSHGAVFVMGAILMKENTLKFEIGYSDKGKSRHLVSMFDGHKSYQIHMCRKCTCVSQNCHIRTNIVDAAAVSQKIYNFYSAKYIREDFQYNS